MDRVPPSPHRGQHGPDVVRKDRIAVAGAPGSSVRNSSVGRFREEARQRYHAAEHGGALSAHDVEWPRARRVRSRRSTPAVVSSRHAPQPRRPPNSCASART